MNKPGLFKLLIFFIISLGVLLSVYQFLYNRSLWNDEATLSLNIIHKSPAKLLKPLDLAQVAPLLFLEIEHFIFYFISGTEYGLRLFPLLSFIASIFFLYQILKIVFKNRSTHIFALSLFVFNSVLLYYSSEVKQYMSDVLVANVLYYCLIKTYKRDFNRYVTLAIVGAVSIFLSNISIIILFTFGLYLIFDSYKKKAWHPGIIYVFLTWSITFGIYYFSFILNHPTRDYMVGYWSREQAFLPLNPLSRSFYLFLFAKSQMIFYFLFGYGNLGKIFFPLLFLTGIFNLYSRKAFGSIMLITLPIMVHLALSGLKMYPFDKRLILYLYPIFIIAIAFGFDLCRVKLAGIVKPKVLAKLAPVVVVIPIYFCSFVYFNSFPMVHTEIKQSINFIKSRLENNQRVYVYYDLVPAFTYYNQTRFMNLKNPVTYGFYDPDRNNYINQLKLLKGKNWLLLSYEGTDAEKSIIATLDKLKYKKIESYTFGGASAYLYDFGNQ
jgi:hypothetical protein